MNNNIYSGRKGEKKASLYDNISSVFFLKGEKEREREKFAQNENSFVRLHERVEFASNPVTFTFLCIFHSSHLATGLSLSLYLSVHLLSQPFLLFPSCPLPAPSLCFSLSLLVPVYICSLCLIAFPFALRDA